MAKTKIGDIIIKHQTEGQKEYLNLLNKKQIIICSGPAGTGKTYLAVLKALEMLNNAAVEKIIISRPIVESGESLGYLPGDFSAKISPYMEPTDEIMNKILGNELFQTLKKNKKIESCPLAYMRGRTFHKAVMLLDEAQNATMAQIKMFLTRMGQESKAIICGDPDQSDLNERNNIIMSLIGALDDIVEIGTITLTNIDIVRNKLIGTILNRLDKI